MKKFTFLFAIILLSFSGIAQEKENTEIDWEAFRLKVIKASDELERERNDRLTNRYTELFEEADREFYKQFYCPCECCRQTEKKENRKTGKTGK